MYNKDVYDYGSSLTVDIFLFFYSLLVLPLGEIKMYIHCYSLSYFCQWV